VRPVVIVLMILGAYLFSAGCAYQQPYHIPLAPEVGSIGLEKPIPLEVGLLISEESRDRIFASAPYPDRRFGDDPLYKVEPYQLAVGQTFEKAALQIFSRAFRKVTLLHTLEEARSYPLVIEPRLEDFYFHLAYYVYALYRPRTELVDAQCKVQVAGTLLSRGTPIWQKRIETPVQADSWVSDYWLGKSVGKLASDTLVLALKDLAYRMVEDSKRPQQPTPGWLDEIDRVKR
jgi:hypothetical protein